MLGYLEIFVLLLSKGEGGLGRFPSDLRWSGRLVLGWQVGRVVLVFDSSYLFVVVRFVEAEHFLIVLHFEIVVLLLNLVLLNEKGMVFLKLGHCLVELEAFGGKSNLVEFGDFRADEISGANKREEGEYAPPLARFRYFCMRRCVCRFDSMAFSSSFLRSLASLAGLDRGK